MFAEISPMGCMQGRSFNFGAAAARYRFVWRPDIRRLRYAVNWSNDRKVWAAR